MTESHTSSRKVSNAPIVIAEQGSFFCGGSVYQEDGEERRSGHVYVQYQVPVDARSLPLVLIHDGNATGKVWETTPDGREGFQNLLIRQGFSVYIVDLPGRGRAAGTARGRGRAAGSTAPSGIPRRNQSAVYLWNVHRLGHWEPPAERTHFETLQFPKDDAAIEQWLRTAVVASLPWDQAEPAAVTALCALLDRVGPCVLVTSSAGGILGWLVRSRHEDVRGIVAYEPARFVFPDDDIPPPVPTEDTHVNRIVNEMSISLSAGEFASLAEIPIQVVYGDNIATEPSPITGVETWRAATLRAEQFVGALECRQGDAEVVHLPRKGLYGNTHCPFSNLNNADIARLFVEFLTSRGLA